MNQPPAHGGRTGVTDRGGPPPRGGTADRTLRPGFGPAAGGSVMAPPAPPRPVSAPPGSPSAPRTEPRATPSWQAAGRGAIAGGLQRIHVNPAMSSRYKAALSALTVLVVLAVCAVGSYLMVLDETRGTGAQAGGSSPQPTAVPVDITTREKDAAPLTVAEVFPGQAIVVDPQKPNEVYTVLRTQELVPCKTATSGEISKLIEELGCSQVIRATMSSPTNGYLVTGGIMNLETADDASDAWDRIRIMVEQNQGRFVGYAERNDQTTKPLVLAPTHAGWNIRGHFLVYCVIARTDEQEIAAGDPFAKQILYDVIEYYLKGKIIDGRAFDPIEASPAAGTEPTGAVATG